MHFLIGACYQPITVLHDLLFQLQNHIKTIAKTIKYEGKVLKPKAIQSNNSKMGFQNSPCYLK